MGFCVVAEHRSVTFSLHQSVACPLSPETHGYLTIIQYFGVLETEKREMIRHLAAVDRLSLRFGILLSLLADSRFTSSAGGTPEVPSRSNGPADQASAMVGASEGGDPGICPVSSSGRVRTSISSWFAVNASRALVRWPAARLGPFPDSSLDLRVSVVPLPSKNANVSP